MGGTCCVLAGELLSLHACFRRFRVDRTSAAPAEHAEDLGGKLQKAQLTLGQHGFELCGSTRTWNFSADPQFKLALSKGQLGVGDPRVSEGAALSRTWTSAHMGSQRPDPSLHPGPAVSSSCDSDDAGFLGSVLLRVFSLVAVNW